MGRSQSLSSRAMSFDLDRTKDETRNLCLNPFRAGRCLSTDSENNNWYICGLSQSLSSRAMSFDRSMSRTTQTIKVSIPFEQGDVFRPSEDITTTCRDLRLNPFRAGRCLSTNLLLSFALLIFVSIPFEQGDVFRLLWRFIYVT